MVAPAPETVPVGLHLSRVARTVGRAFDEALAEAGGSLPVWLVLLNLKMAPNAHQRQLAEAVGVWEATLTHHLNTMEANGVLIRRRDSVNRRIHIVELTEEGDALFHRLCKVAVDFDARLRSGVSDQEVKRLGRLLDRLSANVGAGPDE